MKVSSPLSRVAALLAVAGVVGLAGCASSSTPTGADGVPGASPTPTPTPPWPDDSGPVVVIEFERDGTPTTLTGELKPGGLLSCVGDSITIANKSPEAGVGVSFDVVDDDRVLSWVVGDDLVAQFSGSGALQMEVGDDGATTYTALGAEGWASVQPRDPALASIGDYDPSVAEQLDATSSFTATCPAP
ncbi:hypothetical protein GCM10010988_27330 [Cnuibacter physcomitrellae]|uniref:Uncharacterized protein n=1 Tax=Cnuibacter physcomitrellae TaxID=1619308 RepID=A0A1X9LFQ3_9MICO|nr:hypothetical protein B5808_01410 [Cnuibacter physcomitrellae]GGI40087.1 hypothetical protein GCM10010988_27330 [Cnuibacter physcomitrellae]